MKMYFFLCMCTLFAGVRSGIFCRNNEDLKVDWFIMYKPPNTRGNGLNYFYMDSDDKQWVFNGGNLQEHDNALYYTLKTVYRNNTNQKNAHFMYNDMPPNAEPVNGIFGNKFGATKGVVSFDANGGYWLIHSVPEFPPKQGEGYSYPEVAITHAHMHLCISMKKSSMDHIWNQLLHTLPYIYDQNVPETFRKEDVVEIVLKNYNMNFRVKKSHQKQDFTSRAGQQFTYFAKSVGFNKEIYDDWILRDLQSDFYVQGQEGSD